jgi:tetratricopeptide (TPR) repeat protein
VISIVRPASVVLLFLSLLGFAGCAAFGVPATTDPAGKLRDATALFDRQDRPLPAERLIREALELYQKNGDQLGVAEAYRTYGFFFRSSSVNGKWSKFYRDNGFLDRSATFDTLYIKSIEYFEMARAIYSAHQRLDALTNVDLNMGFTYELMGDPQAACQAFDRSRQDHTEMLRRNPGARIEMQGFSTYEQFLAPHRQRAGCS